MARLVLAGAGATGGLMIDLGAARKGSEVTVVKAVDGGGVLRGREEFVVFGSVRRWLLKMRVGEDFGLGGGR